MDETRPKAAQYCPPPWRYDATLHCVEDATYGEVLAECVEEENGPLIAAAPDLLAALKALYDACEKRANQEGGDFGPDIGPAAELANAAIAKAERGQ